MWYPSSATRSLRSPRPCPRGRRLICRPQSTCPCQHILPTSQASHAVLQLPVHIKRLVCLDLHLPYAVAGRDALLNRRLELVAPRTPPAVAVAVVVAAQEVTLRLGAFLDSEGDVDRLEQVFFQRGIEGYDVVDVALDILGVEPAEEVAGAG
jgi:hypothetical protein